MNLRRLLWTTCLACVIATSYSWWQLTAVGARYDEINQMLANETMPTVQAGDKQLRVPSYDLFKPGRIWTYVAKSAPLPESYTPSLIDIPVAHGDADKSMQVASNISAPLQKLVEAAKGDGVGLMVASAYRSRADQTKLYDGFMTERGQEYTVSHVAAPGTSEHQSGMAVDFSSSSPTCAANSDKCELNFVAIGWLAKNAPKFGFIQRYPMGKQSITGFSNEEWHYRYVGIPLAQALTEANLTLDEFVQQVAPGYARIAQ